MSESNSTSFFCRFDFTAFFPPLQEDCCNSRTAGVCKFNQTGEGCRTQSWLIDATEAVLGFVFASFTVGDVFACTFCLIQLS